MLRIEEIYLLRGIIFFIIEHMKTYKLGLKARKDMVGPVLN
jgi:hypothetical protein